MDSAASPQRLEWMLAHWVGFLSPTGLICGVALSEEQRHTVFTFFDHAEVMTSQTDFWYVTAASYRDVPANAPVDPEEVASCV